MTQTQMERKRKKDTDTQTVRRTETERESKIQRLKNRKENEREGKVIISFDPGIRQLNYHLLPITYDNNIDLTFLYIKAIICIVKNYMKTSQQ